MVLAGKNILVTGGTGFIASHLVNKLVEKKANIIVPYQSINPKSYFFTQQLDKKVILVHKNIKDYKRTLDIITKYEIDFIFHLAAQSIVPTAFHNPLETFETNIIGTANILESARLYKNIKGIIVISSDKAYGKIPRASENNSLSGDHPYETSKASCDLIATTYYKTYNLPVIVSRFGNVYGEGDINFSRIIPGIIKSIIRKQRLEIRSDGQYIRDYVYVGDIINALILLAHSINKAKGEVFNISSSENLSVLDLVRKTEKILNVKIKYVINNNARNEIPIQSINFTKIKKILGWKPQRSLINTLPDIHQWYQEFFDISNKKITSS